MVRRADHRIAGGRRWWSGVAGKKVIREGSLLLFRASRRTAHEGGRYDGLCRLGGLQAAARRRRNAGRVMAGRRVVREREGRGLVAGFSRGFVKERRWVSFVFFESRGRREIQRRRWFASGQGRERGDLGKTDKRARWASAGQS